MTTVSRCEPARGIARAARGPYVLFFGSFASARAPAHSLALCMARGQHANTSVCLEVDYAQATYARCFRNETAGHQGCRGNELPSMAARGGLHQPEKLGPWVEQRMNFLAFSTQVSPGFNGLPRTKADPCRPSLSRPYLELT